MFWLLCPASAQFSYLLIPKMPVRDPHIDEMHLLVGLAQFTDWVGASMAKVPSIRHQSHQMLHMVVTGACKFSQQLFIELTFIILFVAVLITQKTRLDCWMFLRKHCLPGCVYRFTQILTLKASGNGLNSLGRY